MLLIRVVQCLCTQCEGELLHLYEVCLPVISVEHMSQVHVWVVGPGFVSTSPDRARSPASHMRGSMGRLTEKTVPVCSVLIYGFLGCYVSDCSVLGCSVPVLLFAIFQVVVF